jgi:hypothetical protein
MLIECFETKTKKGQGSCLLSLLCLSALRSNSLLSSPVGVPLTTLEFTCYLGPCQHLVILGLEGLGQVGRGWHGKERDRGMGCDLTAIFEMARYGLWVAGAGWDPYQELVVIAPTEVL